MGVGFSSKYMTIATTSVREDMVVALVKAFGNEYEQIILVGDPLFFKKLTDYASETGLDWGKYHINVILGEEVFGEYFRNYLATSLKLEQGRPGRGYIMSSCGAAELGLHLCFETPSTIALRQVAFQNPEFAQDLFQIDENTAALPILMTFDPLRIFIEIIQPSSTGYGRMAFSMLNTKLQVPLLRYETGDIASFISRAHALTIGHRHGISLPEDLPQMLIALRGRSKG